jgi:hypothetical protein
MKHALRLAMLLLIWAAIAMFWCLDSIQTPVGYSHPPECLCVDCERSWDVQWMKDHEKEVSR